ncbi:MAG: hypothetical protein SOI66_07380 [Bifidobacterium sp.]|jgi:hypothetical protein
MSNNKAANTIQRSALFEWITRAISATKEAEQDRTSAKSLEKDHRSYYIKRGVSDFRARISGGQVMDFFETLDSVSDSSKIPVARTLLNRMGDAGCEISSAKDGSTWVWTEGWLAVTATVAANAEAAVNANVAANDMVVANVMVAANALALADPARDDRRLTLERERVYLSDSFLNSQMFIDLSKKGYSQVRQEALLKGMLNGRIDVVQIVSQKDGTIHVEGSYAGCDLQFDAIHSADGKTITIR